MAGRGRPAGSKNKPKSQSTVVGGAAAPPGHNSGQSVEGINDDQLHALTRHHMTRRASLVASEKKAHAERMNYDKIIKSDLGPNGLKDIKLLEDLNNPENQTTKEKEIQQDIERQLRVARWAGMAIGEQADLFGPDKRSQREKGYDAGKRDGLDGKGMSPNYGAGTEGHDGYLEGWRAGQLALAGAIKKTPEKDAPGIIRGNTEEGSGADDFDSASDSVPPEEDEGSEAEEQGDEEDSEIDPDLDEPEDNHDEPSSEETVSEETADQVPAGGQDDETWPDDQQIAGRTGDAPESDDVKI